MLSKKMTVSLMSLITILALAFAVTPAMAADDFDATLSVMRVSTVSDHNAMYSQPIEVTLTFGAQVDGTTATLTIFVEDKNGSQTSVTAPKISKKDLNSVQDGVQNNNKVFMFTIPAAATTENDKKVHLHVAKGVKEIVPLGSAKSSKEGKLTIDLVGTDMAPPGVVSIELAPGIIVPAAGYTGATIDVIITLSEKPKAFTAADHLSVTEAATVANPVALDPVMEQSASEISARFKSAGVGDPPPMRMLYDAGDVKGIHDAINNGSYVDPQDDEAWDLTTTSASDEENTPTIPSEPAKMLAAEQTQSPGEGYPVAIPAGTDRTVVPKEPVVTDYDNAGEYQQALDFYTSYSTMKAAYDAEMKRLEAYNEAVDAEKMMDRNARDMYYADQFGEEVPRGTGYDSMLYPYLVTITPKYANKNAVVVKVKAFEDQTLPTALKYMPPMTEAEYMEGKDKLTIKIGKEVLAAKTTGIEVNLLNEGIIPKDGYLVVAKDTGASAVRNPGDPKKSPANPPRKPEDLTYNLISGGLQNLESFLTNGGTIDLVSPNAGLVISEIMWGSDASIADSSKSQYIEIRNTSGADIKMGDKTHKLVFYAAGSSLPDMSVAANNIQDRVGTIGAGGYWSIAGKGQSGRTGIDEAPGDVVAVTPTQALISMQRVIDATGVAADGTLAGSWAQSSPPGLNFDLTKEGTRIGSPGRAPTTYPVAPTPEPAAVVVPVAMPDDIMITEIMVDTGDGRLPQWIELTNVSGAEVSLAGWSLMITNAEADADAIGETVSINLSGTLGVGGGEDAGGTMGKSLLLVGGAARSSSNLSGSTRVVDISSQVDQTGRYTFISTMAFMAALVPPQMTGVVAYGDTAGNLDADEAWEIPMDESGRSSLIRREMDAKGMATMGTDANGWVLASSTSLVSGPATWYGSDEDAGTPGYDAGGPLPVELSHFRPARDKQTGAVVITWSTQSELNNAGFFIKRSQQRDGQFKVINATMVAGAGTSSEKQSYTYTDSTAQPNVVYYYQIEDVSLDGQRQTLTHGTRLKGHIGAAGKLTSTWGEIKSSNE